MWIKEKMQVLLNGVIYTVCIPWNNKYLIDSIYSHASETENQILENMY